VANITDQIHTLVTPEPNLHLPKHFTYAVVDQETGKSMEYKHLIQQEKIKDKWTRSFANELGRLAQGVGNRHKGTKQSSLSNTTQCPQAEKLPTDAS
jgi:hypothetical protein